MCLKFFKKKFKKKIFKKKIKNRKISESESYLKNSPNISPILSINRINIERNILSYSRDYERNPLMETLSGSLSPPKNQPLIYQIGNYDSDITCSDDSIYFSEPEIK